MCYNNKPTKILSIVITADTSNPPSYDQFLNHINLLCNKLMKVLTVAHQGQAIFMMQASQYNSNLQYRRDVVFSQAVSHLIQSVLNSEVSKIFFYTACNLRVRCRNEAVLFAG